MDLMKRFGEIFQGIHGNNNQTRLLKCKNQGRSVDSAASIPELTGKTECSVNSITECGDLHFMYL